MSLRLAVTVADPEFQAGTVKEHEIREAEEYK